MSDTTTITIRTKKELKREAQQFFDSLWLSISSAFNLFLNDVVTNRAINFSITQEEPLTLYPMEYDELPQEGKDTYNRLLAWDTSGFTTYKPVWS